MVLLIARTAFQKRLFESLREKGITIKDLLRIYQPYESGDEIECLIVDHSAGAITVWCDPTGKITHGPEPGFGPEPDEN